MNIGLRPGRITLEARLMLFWVRWLGIAESHANSKIMGRLIMGRLTLQSLGAKKKPFNLSPLS